MTQVIATLDLIRRSMYLINALAAGEMPADMDANDALLTLNEMMDGWNLQPLAVFGVANETVTLTIGQSVYDWGTTAGPTGIITERPAFIQNATCNRQGVSTPVKIISQQEYDRIALKSTPSSLVERLLYVNSFPLGQMTLFPVPSEVVTLSLMVGRQLPGQPTLQSYMQLPPGYLEALRFNLAVRLWPEYTNSATDIDSIKQIANQSLGNVKRANIEPVEAFFDNIPGVDSSGRSWDWRMG